jgi:hypothetical protein
VLRVGQVARPPALRDPAEVGRRPQALGVLGPVVILPVGARAGRSRSGLPAQAAVPGEPADGKDRPVAVRAEDHLNGGVRCQDVRHGDVGRQVGDGGPALPAARVQAVGAGAVGAQPHCRQPPQRGMARTVRFPRPARFPRPVRGPGPTRRLGPHRSAGQACHTGLPRLIATAARPAAPGCRSRRPGGAVTPPLRLPTSVNIQGTECQLRWRSLPGPATHLPIAVHPHDPPGRGSHTEGDATRRPFVKPARGRRASGAGSRHAPCVVSAAR